ncbi:MAG TPA: hypothetical protein VFM18_17265 [Methanosarcina sp.]|nr:hypothetical protein [Methanosarcina sp.]
MAKSRTRRKYNKAKKVQSNPFEGVTREEFNNEVARATDQIKSWTRRRLSDYQKSKNPVCIPTETGYIIGLYRLHVHANKTCNVYDCDNELIHIFDNKVNAVLYTIYSIKQKIEIANEILDLDETINRNYTDMILLRRSILNATKQKDFFVVDARQARLVVVEQRLQQARDRMAKIHQIAKQAKIWQKT